MEGAAASEGRSDERAAARARAAPRLLQSRRWSREPLPFLEQCRARYGDTFTLRLRHLGTWVLLSDPEDVKRVFSADTNDLGVGVPNLALRPVLGAHSVMLSEEPEHMARRKLMLPRFHGERMREDAEMMTELARREVRAWPVERAVRALAADAGADPGGRDAGGLRRRRGPRWTGCGRC